MTLITNHTLTIKIKTKPKTINRSKGNQYPHIKQTKTIKEQQEYTFTTHIAHRQVTRTQKLPLQQITYTHCPECNCTVYEYDQHHAETFCPQCGLVLDEQTINTNNEHPTNNEHSKPRYNGLTREEKKVLKHKQHSTLKHTPKENWVTYNDTRLIDCITNQFTLTTTQNKMIHEIIMEQGFQRLHRQLSKEKIILAVTRYVMKISDTHPSYLRFNNYFSDITLQEYNVIESNIIKNK